MTTSDSVASGHGLWLVPRSVLSGAPSSWSSPSDRVSSGHGLWLVLRSVLSGAPSSRSSSSGRVSFLQRLCPCPRRPSAVAARSCGEGRTAWWCWASRCRRRALEEGCRRRRHSAHQLAAPRLLLVADRPSTDFQSRRDLLALQLPHTSSSYVQSTDVGNMASASSSPHPYSTLTRKLMTPFADRISRDPGHVATSQATPVTCSNWTLKDCQRPDVTLSTS